jgi:hypothetical protein
MRRAYVLVLALIGCVLCGCGHKASEADCQLIVDRMIEVQLDAHNLTDPDERKRQKDIMTNRTTGMDMKDCVGRRVTDGMLECVKKAQTQDEIQTCLR